jgi:hypothetical protein
MLAGAGAVLLGFLGLLAAPLTAGASLGSAVFSTGALAGSVTLITVAGDLVRPRWSAWLASAAAAVASTAAGLLVTEAGGCCLYRFTIHRGFPLAWHHQAQELPDGSAFLAPGTVTEGQGWAFLVGGVEEGVDPRYLAADLAFWGGVTLTIIVVVGLLLAARRRGLA